LSASYGIGFGQAPSPSTPAFRKIRAKNAVNIWSCDLAESVCRSERSVNFAYVAYLRREATVTIITSLFGAKNALRQLGTAYFNEYESPPNFRIRWIGSTNFVPPHRLRVSRELSGLMHLCVRLL
jgi:hypothetical protein